MSEPPRDVRAPAVAGTFYDDEPGRLAGDIDGFLARAPADPTAPAPKALIVPHAGYAYSGPIAGSAYATLLGRASGITRVLLLGPAHRVALDGMAVPSVDGFATPLGVVPIDAAARVEALACPGVAVDDAPHRDEHSLEVQLPFLQRILGAFSVLPIVVGRAPSDAVSDLLDALWGGAETLIVVSSDLSHYEEMGRAARHDRATAEKVLTGEIATIDPHDACGAYPVRGLIESARRHHLEPALLDLRSSGDTAGPHDRVVGYGAFAFTGDDQPSSDTTEAERQALLDVAVVAVRDALRTGSRRVPEPDELPSSLRRPAATFVTLEDPDGALLGCIGTLEAEHPIGSDVARHALAAAFDDPRLPPLTPAEYARMTVHISVLSPLEDLAVHDLAELRACLRPGIDGLLVEAGAHHATFLPAVWEKVADPTEFLALLWQKAGLPPASWPAGMRVRRYTTESFEAHGPRPSVGASA